VELLRGLVRRQAALQLRVSVVLRYSSIRGVILRVSHGNSTVRLGQPPQIGISSKWSSCRWTGLPNLDGTPFPRTKYDRRVDVLPITFSLLEAHLATLLPRPTYVARFEESRNGPVIRIIPANPRAAELSIWVGGNAGQCDFAFGKAFFRDIDIGDGEDLLELIDATIRGGLVESIWTFGGHELYSKSTLQLKGRRAVIRNGIWLFYPPWLKHTYTYEPYVIDSA